MPWIPIGRASKLFNIEIRGSIPDLSPWVRMADRLIDLFATVLGSEPDRLTDESSPANTPEWDSVSNIMLVTEIEAVFNIELSTGDIESMSSVGRVREVLRRLGVAGL
jgi:acyl carrier protein